MGWLRAGLEECPSSLSCWIGFPHLKPVVPIHAAIQRNHLTTHGSLKRNYLHSWTAFRSPGVCNGLKEKRLVVVQKCDKRLRQDDPIFGYATIIKSSWANICSGRNWSLCNINQWTHVCRNILYRFHSSNQWTMPLTPNPLWVVDGLSSPKSRGMTLKAFYELLAQRTNLHRRLHYHNLSRFGNIFAAGPVYRSYCIALHYHSPPGGGELATVCHSNLWSNLWSSHQLIRKPI